MCGVWALLGLQLPPEVVAACLKALLARGPDATRVGTPHPRVTLGFTRLAINGLTEAGMQPFSAHSDGRLAPPAGAPLHCVVNGEIYNFAELAGHYGIPLSTGSDCEVLLPLWAALDHDGVALARALDGVFAVVLVDTDRDEVVVMRDPYGVRPLYTASVGGGGSGAVATRLWASELKALTPVPGLTDLAPFPPGHVGVYRLSTGALLSLTRYHDVPWVKNPMLAHPEEARKAVRFAFEAAVTKRLLSDRPIGCLLSGGLDSSLVAALLQRSMKAADATKRLETFSIGMSNAPGTDLHFARIVAEHIGSKHHGEGDAALRVVLCPNVCVPGRDQFSLESLSYVCEKVGHKE